MNDSANIKLVIFDLGGVLIRLAPDWRDACEYAAVPYRERLDVADAIHPLICKHEIGELGRDGFHQQLAARVGLTQHEIEKACDACLRGAFPGVHDLLDQLKHTETATACLSNTNHRHWTAMSDPAHANGLPLHLLDHHFASHRVEQRKPGHEIYEHVEQATATPPHEILFFDDTLNNIETAKLRGWHAEQITEPNNPVSQMRKILKSYRVIPE